MDTSLNRSGNDEVDRSFSLAMGQFGADEMAYLIKKGMVKQVDGEWRELSTLMDSDLEVTDDEDESENKKPKDLELTDDEDDENKEPNGTKPSGTEVPPNTPSKPAEASVFFTPKSAKGKDGPRHSMLLRSVCRKSLAVGGTPGGILTPHDANTPCCANEECRDSTLNMMYKTPKSCRKNILEDSLLKEESLMEKEPSGIEDVPPVPMSDSIINSESFNASLLEQSAIIAAMTPAAGAGMGYNDSMNMSVDFIPATQQIEVHITERKSVTTADGKEEMLTEIDYSAVRSYMQASHLSNVSSDFGNVSGSQVLGLSAKQSTTTAEEDLLQGPDATNDEPLRGDSLLEEGTDDDEVGDECDVSFEYRRPSKKDTELKESSVDDDSFGFDMSHLNHSLNDSKSQMSSQKSTDLDDTITTMEKLLAAADQLEDESNNSNIGLECSPMMFSQDTSFIGSSSRRKLNSQQSRQGPSVKKEMHAPGMFATPRAPAPKKTPVLAKTASNSHSAGAASTKMIPRMCRLTATEVKPAATKPAWNSPKNARIPPIKKLSSFLDSPARRLPTPASALSPSRKPVESPVAHYIRSVPTPTQVQRMAKAPKAPVSVSMLPKSAGPKCGIPTKIPAAPISRIPHVGIKTVATPSPNQSRLNRSSTVTPSIVHRPSRLNSLLPMKADKPLSSNVHYVGSAVKSVNSSAPTSAKKITADSEKHAINPVASRHLGLRDVNNDSLVNENPVVRKFCPNRFGFQHR